MHVERVTSATYLKLSSEGRIDLGVKVTYPKFNQCWPDPEVHDTSGFPTDLWEIQIRSLSNVKSCHSL